MKYRFADCVLDPRRHRLTRAQGDVHVEPQVFALLELLARCADRVVTRDQIVDHVWQGRIVSEATISARISAARAAVGDDGRRQAVIRTVNRVGLEMAVPVECLQDEGDGAVGQPPPDVQDIPEIRMASSADGSGIAWQVSGEGPVLLRAGHWLSHLELDWSSPVWRPLIHRLGRGRRLLQYDQRGTGLSERDCGALTLQGFVEDMAAVLDAAGVARAAIFAVSQSVPVALAFAARHPERVSALVLVSGFVQGSLLRDKARSESMTDTFLSLIQSGWGHPDSAFMTAFSSLFMPEGTPEQIDSFIEMQLQSATPQRAVELRQAIGMFDVSGELDKVRCPVLVGHGRRDAVQPFDQGQKLAQGLRDARFFAFDSPNHIAVPQDAGWQDMMSAVDRFLAKQSGDGTGNRAARGQ